MVTRNDGARLLLAFVLASAMALRGHRKRALSTSGAVAAFSVGFATLGSGYRFGAALISFYYAGTRVTRVGAARKKREEDGYAHVNGNRNAVQVLGSSLPGTLLSVLHYVWYGAPGPVYRDLSGLVQISVLLFFAACAGDTFSSEVGSIMASRRPILLVAPWRKVPAGTNGGVSAPGTAASVVGGMVVGTSFALTADARSMLIPSVIAGAIGGFAGSAMDSMLGATLQASWYDAASGRVLKESPKPGSQLAARAVHICGSDILSGEAINALSAVLTMALSPLVLRFYATNGGARW